MYPKSNAKIISQINSISNSCFLKLSNFLSKKLSKNHMIKILLLYLKNYYNIFKAKVSTTLYPNQKSLFHLLRFDINLNLYNLISKDSDLREIPHQDIILWKKDFFFKIESFDLRENTEAMHPVNRGSTDDKFWNKLFVRHDYSNKLSL